MTIISVNKMVQSLGGPFQIHYFPENLVVPGIGPGPLDL
jgi:hypothetical protein